MPAAPRRYLIVVYRPLPTAPLVVFCMYLAVQLSAKADACGRSFAVLLKQVSTAGLCLRHNRLTCYSILEVSRDAVAARKEELVSCAAEQSKYCFICTVPLTIAAIYLSRAGVVGSVFAAALTQV
jgi:hypothetical protein